VGAFDHESSKAGKLTPHCVDVLDHVRGLQVRAGACGCVHAPSGARVSAGRSCICPAVAGRGRRRTTTRQEQSSGSRWCPLTPAGETGAAHLGIAQELRLVAAGLHGPRQRLARVGRAQRRLKPGLPRRGGVSGEREGGVQGARTGDAAARGGTCCSSGVIRRSFFMPATRSPAAAVRCDQRGGLFFLKKNNVVGPCTDHVAGPCEGPRPAAE